MFVVLYEKERHFSVQEKFIFCDYATKKVKRKQSQQDFRKINSYVPDLDHET